MFIEQNESSTDVQRSQQDREKPAEARLYGATQADVRCLLGRNGSIGAVMSVSIHAAAALNPEKGRSQ